MTDDDKKPISNTIYCPPSTRAMLNLIATRRRWSLATTLDVIICEYIAHHEISAAPPSKASP